MLDRRSFIAVTAAAATLPTMSAAAAEINYLHTVLFNFKDGVSPAKREEVLAEIRNQAKLPGVQSMFIGPNILRSSAASPYEWVLMLDFASEADSTRFQRSAAHNASVDANFTPYRAGLVFCDLRQPFESKIADKNGAAFRRVVMFNFKDSVGDAERNRIMADIEAMLKRFKIDRVAMGRNAYRRTADSPLDWMIMLEWARQEQIEAYQNAPEQQAFDQQVFNPAVTDVVVADVRL